MSSSSLEGHETVSHVPPHRRRKRFDRAQAARLFADGLSTGEVADKLGCSRQHVWRLVRHSKLLPRAIADAEAQVGLDAEVLLKGLRPTVARGIARELDERNVRVLLWCADRLGLARDDDNAGDGEDEPLTEMSYTDVLRQKFAAEREIERREQRLAELHGPDDADEFEDVELDEDGWEINHLADDA